MAELDPHVEAQLADLSDADWANLEARVRPPNWRPDKAADGRAEAVRRGYITEGDE